MLLDDINVVLKPGRMTLLLGPPGSGKSILMKTLAGMAPPIATVSRTLARSVFSFSAAAAVQLLRVEKRPSGRAPLACILGARVLGNSAGRR